MKLEKFIDNLLSIGFIQNSNEACSNWYENHIKGTSIMVGIMAHEIDYLGHIPITVNCLHDDDDKETEKDYMTTTGAWNAIIKILNS